VVVSTSTSTTNDVVSLVGSASLSKSLVVAAAGGSVVALVQMGMWSQMSLLPLAVAAAKSSMHNPKVFDVDSNHASMMAAIERNLK
jgi:hypothetical protein